MSGRAFRIPSHFGTSSEGLIAPTFTEPPWIGEDLIDASGRVLMTRSADTFIRAAREAAPLVQGPSSAIRMALADAATACHKANGTLTDPVRLSIERLLGNAPILNASHQPNTFLSQVISSEVDPLHQAATNFPIDTLMERPIIMFFCIDYDDAGDSRYRTGLIPTYAKAAAAHLSGAVPRRYHHTISATVPAPSAKVVQRWEAALDMSIRMTSHHWPPDLRSSLPSVRHSAQYLIDSVRDTYGNFSTLSAANIRMMSFVSNVVSGSATIFVAGTEVLKRIGSALNESLELLAAAVGELGTADLYRHYWRVCESCGSRARCAAGRGKLIRWECGRCHSSGEQHLDLTEQSAVLGVELPAFVPRVSMCNALDLQIYRFAATSMYVRGVGHMNRSRNIYETTDQPLPPLLAWDPHELLAPLGSSEDQLLRQHLGPEQTTLFQRGRYAQLVHWALTRAP